ncbi:MAG: carbohydrate binding family 9 domain-containing protein [Holophagales bacterium]|nr:MAG: carbohydrate binding family 9 domain-containing protein [Holophagales bacterium]
MGLLRRLAIAVALVLALVGEAVAEAPSGPIAIRRASAAIVVDGELGDAGWVGAAEVADWVETNPGDNIAPKVASRAYLAYDDRFLYAAFRFDDPDPRAIRAPLGDRDNVASYTDYGGVIVDGTHDGRTAQMFLANPRGIQYDALTSDASGEDSAPDWFWDSAARITATGWTLEMRIPFSSLRYQGSNPEAWGILLYRNRPREFRYQMFSSILPRDSNCMVCHARPLVGLVGLPAGGHWVAAPYATGSRVETPEGELGSSLGGGEAEVDGGLDVKWAPSPNTVVDATINPDFSQIEADAPEITANERFALFFPEKRPFFLEGVTLFTTPVQAVYTRTLTSLRYGLRATGGVGATHYTVLTGEDRGGGSVILPGPTGSELAPQDFSSRVLLGRVRRDLGDSFVSLLFTAREIEGGGFNRVLGPDFEWRPTPQDTVTGQLLFSRSDTPERPDLAAEWDGRRLAGHAGELWWYRQTSTWDYFTLYEERSDGFRADTGFVPQVGLRGAYVEVGRTWHPLDRPVSRVRVFTVARRKEDFRGELIEQLVNPAVGFDARWNSFVRLELLWREVRSGERTFETVQFRPTVQIRPGKVLSQVTFNGLFGDEVDFTHSRPGSGWTAKLTADLQPTDHLQVALATSRRVLDVERTELGRAGRLFTADVARLRAVYMLSSRAWVRLIGEWIETRRDPALWSEAVEPRSASFAGSALVAFKLNWQTVLFVGYGDNRTLDDADELQPESRQLFFKLSYAFQG